MPGQTIAESRAGFHPLQGNINIKSHNSDLKVPVVKVTSLRIETDNPSMWKASLRVRYLWAVLLAF